jgi:uncharacterized membrane protein YhiD involved in acid resistance
MDRIDRNEKDNSQKAKLIFFSLAALVVILLIWSIVSANKARLERDTAREQVELLKLENVKLEQMVKDLHQDNEGFKKRLQQCQAKPKAKPAVKKKTKAAKSTTTKKTSKPSKNQ